MLCSTTTKCLRHPIVICTLFVNVIIFGAPADSCYVAVRAYLCMPCPLNSDLWWITFQWGFDRRYVYVLCHCTYLCGWWTVSFPTANVAVQGIQGRSEQCSSCWQSESKSEKIEDFKSPDSYMNSVGTDSSSSMEVSTSGTQGGGWGGQGVFLQR